jgi:hypothetical protein
VDHPDQAADETSDDYDSAVKAPEQYSDSQRGTH